MSNSDSIILISVICSFLLWGTSLVMTGAQLPHIMDEFGLSQTQAGLLIACRSLAIVCGSWASVKLIRIFPINVIFVCAGATALLALVRLYFASTPVLFVSSFCLIGVMAGISITVGHTLIGDCFTANRTAKLAILDVAFSTGSLSAPLGVMALDGGNFDWRMAFLVLAGLFGLLILLKLALLPSVSAFTRSNDGDEADNAEDAGKNQRAPPAMFVLLGLVGFLFGTIEWAQITWTASVAIAEHASDNLAQTGLAAFLTGMLLARVLAVFAASRLQNANAPLYLLGLGLGGNLLLNYGPMGNGIFPATLLIGNLLSGIGIGAIFTLALGRAMDCSPGHLAMASATLMAGVVAGSQIASVFLGWLADNHGGIIVAFRAVPPFFVLLIVCYWFFRQTTGTSDT